MGFLTRTVLFPRTSPSTPGGNSEDDLDAAVVNHPFTESLTCHQHVVYSASFQVPAFYFSIHDSNGSPLPVSDIIKTTLLRSSILDNTEATPFAVSSKHASFPLLSQGDHPVLGTPSWYLHPCETAAAIGEIIAEVVRPEWGEEARLVRWLEAWFMMVCTAIDLQAL